MNFVIYTNAYTQDANLPGVRAVNIVQPTTATPKPAQTRVASHITAYDDVSTAPSTTTTDDTPSTTVHAATRPRLTMWQCTIDGPITCACVNRYGIETVYVRGPARVIAATGADKKNIGGVRRFVLPLGIGDAGVVEDLTPQELDAAVRYMLAQATPQSN